MKPAAAPARLVRRFINALELHAVVIAAIDGSVMLATTEDPALRLRAIAKRFGTVTRSEVFWFAGALHATFVTDATRSDLIERTSSSSSKWFPIDVNEAVSVLEDCARTQGVRLATAAELERNAVAAIAVVTECMGRMNRNGGLQSLNRAYREFRLAKKEAGEAAPPYAVFLYAQKERLVAAVAEVAARQGCRFGDIPREYALRAVQRVS